MLLLAVAVGVGGTLGIALALSANITDFDMHGDLDVALPSRLYDRHGRLITEFFAAERREMISIDDLPKHLIHALLVREDRTFFRHNGFSIRGTFRAGWNIVTGRYVSGGSTITQQLAGHIFDDRDDISIARKIRELWWAFQLERHWTKHEILEAYLNRMYFGHNTYGVEAASQFYFGRSARHLTPAESAMLVIQLANPARYSPLRHPQRARTMQRVVLNGMVRAGYLSAAQADDAFEAYWQSYDFTRAAISSAFLDRRDEAPYFSEYVRERLEADILLGVPVDIHRSGLSIYSTLDLQHQRLAEENVRAGLDRANASVAFDRARASDRVSADLVSIIDLLGLSLDKPELLVSAPRSRQLAVDYYLESLAPLVGISSLLFSSTVSDGLHQATRSSVWQQRTRAPREQVQGALVTLENDTGHITAMVGGAGFERIDQLNRAIAGRRTPGSAFKPLYYVAALEDGIITPATVLYDAPTAFRNLDGTLYMPRNYAGTWNGPVSVRTAMSRSLNIPSVQVFHRLGFTRALSTSAELLGISSDQMAGRGLERRYPVALGIAGVSPLEMARAFAVFPNLGMRVDPLAIRYVADSRGRVIAEPERDLRIEQRRMGSDARIVSPQAAYLMTHILEDTFVTGTLRARDPIVPMAAKSGTTQNWADGWVVGSSTRYTTAIWYGFDRGGRTLGTQQFGAALVGPDWERYMNAIHARLPAESFTRPDGIVEVLVSARTGLLAPPDYPGPTRKELFVSGTEPTRFAAGAAEQRDAAAASAGRLARPLASRGLLPLDERLERRIPTLDSLLGPVATPTAAPEEETSLDTEWDDFNPLLD